MVMKDDQRRDMFEKKWDLWCPAVIEYALATKNKSAALKSALQDLYTDIEGIIKSIIPMPFYSMTIFAESESITAFRCLGLLLRTKKRGESANKETPDVPFLMCQVPVSVYYVH